MEYSASLVIFSLVECCGTDMIAHGKRIVLGVALAGAITIMAVGQRPDRPGPPGGGPDPRRMVEHALQFDADGDGKLDRAELQRFAEEFTRLGPGRNGGGGNAAPGGGNRGRGNAALPKPQVSIEVRGEFRWIESNGLPDHDHGEFPNRGNPNRISEQRYAYRVPVHPQPAAEPYDLQAGPFGVALNGIPFDPGTAELWRGNPAWRYDALSGKINLGIDSSNAHVQPNGAYHYHGLPVGLLERIGKPNQVTLVGYAADGFPVYNQWGYTDPTDGNSPIRKLRSSYRLKSGSRPATDSDPGGEYDGTFNQDYEYVPGLGDLDDCNGRTGVTPEYPSGTYYYVITEQFPFISRKLRGNPDESFLRRRRPG